MALTEQEESKLRTVLTAFDNGKRIADLPAASGGLEDYTVEVQDVSGESARLNLFHAISTVNKKTAIRRWDETKATPIGEAYGNLDFLRDLPSVLGLGCYLVTDDRKRRKLDPTNHYKFADGSPAKLDGSDGQYMWCWNAHYYASWKEGNYFYEAVSLNPIDGVECYKIPAGGTSALGNAVLDHTTSTLCSLISDDPKYRGGGNQADWDGTYRTQLGKPITAIAMTSCSVYARKRGEGWESQWYVSRAVQEYLFRLIMGTRDSQSAFNPAKDANGLYCCGLGAGVTEITSAAWSTYNGYFPLVPTSAGVELGDGVGVAAYNVPAADGSVYHAAKIPVFFGLKNLYGNLWTGVRGLIIDAGAEISSVYVAPSLYQNYSNDSVAGMIKAAECYRTDSYIKKISMNKLCCMPTEPGGTTATYYCDHHYVNHNSSQGLRCRLVGGSAYYGAAAGAFVSLSYLTVAHSDAAVSGALCFFEADPVMQ